MKRAGGARDGALLVQISDPAELRTRPSNSEEEEEERGSDVQHVRVTPARRVNFYLTKGYTFIVWC